MSVRTGADYRAYREKFWGLEPPPHLKHGPATWAAKVYGCPCSTCLPSGKRTWKHTEGATGPLSGTERGRRLRASKRGQPVPEGTKHGGYASRVYGCKCEVCRGANAAEKHEKDNAWRALARGRWQTIGDRWRGIEVICWPPKDAGPDWVCPHPSHEEN